ncbi:hypothetical protein Prubr_41540 [Polymorphospora rubra]|uniref:Ribonucleotide reductase class II vitamin B12-dependent N-terminal domain-containing protein n=1 Tax=Polymorphospora rubra TaxID=338584 RepID=A0A810N662_9ACTN|nr:hypothetical protein Prubr_41540 [Polymorphospora rubra]
MRGGSRVCQGGYEMSGESVTTSKGRTRTASTAGLKVERVWTTEGVHPYDEVTWERRDVVMTNWRDGSVNFEQRGVEYPTSWSVNAANIVTTKYFRGAVGTPSGSGRCASSSTGSSGPTGRRGRSTATSPRRRTPRSSNTS